MVKGSGAIVFCLLKLLQSFKNFLTILIPLVVEIKKYFEDESFVPFKKLETEDRVSLQLNDY